jgi:hypothetical protein
MVKSDMNDKSSALLDADGRRMFGETETTEENGRDGHENKNPAAPQKPTEPKTTTSRSRSA